MKPIYLLLAGAALLVGVLALGIKTLGSVGSNQGFEPEQPIPFSHKIHAGDNGINCLYCHAPAEKGRHAGIPPTALCMNCHANIKKDSPEIEKINAALARMEPVEWVKVHALPDHAYFNHAQHVKVGKLSCQQCHGPVESMTRVRQDKPHTMGWCLECHRASGIAPPNDVKANTGANCSSCHF